MSNHLVQILANFDEKGYAPQDRIGPEFYSVAIRAGIGADTSLPEEVVG
jgi:hypothetical protein